MLRRHIRLVLATLALLGLATAWGHSSLVPLYDGVGFPDEPYRYISAPAGASPTAAASSATDSSVVTNGANGTGLYAVSQEQAPQVVVFLIERSLFASGAGHVVVHADPIAPATQPVNGTIDGNAYTVSATSDGGAVTYDAKTAANNYIDLRLSQGAPASPVFVYKPAGAKDWQRLQAMQVGTDIYETGIPGLGDFALATFKQAAAGPAAPTIDTTANNSDTAAAGLSRMTLVVIVGGVLLVVVLVVIVIRWRSGGSGMGDGPSNPLG